MDIEDDRPQAGYSPQGESEPVRYGVGYDPDTGELPEGEPLRPEEPTRAAPAAQEILPPGTERAFVGGQVMQTVAHTGGSFVEMLEDGQFSHDLHHALAEVQQALTQEAARSGRKAKGKVVVTIDLDKEGEMYGATAKIKVTKPEAPRAKSVLWDDGSGNFTRFPPNQSQMFGLRPVRTI